MTFSRAIRCVMRSYVTTAFFVPFYIEIAKNGALNLSLRRFFAPRSLSSSASLAQRQSNRLVSGRSAVQSRREAFHFVHKTQNPRGTVDIYSLPMDVSVRQPPCAQMAEVKGVGTEA